MSIDQFSLAEVRAIGLKRWVRSLEKKKSVLVQLSSPLTEREYCTQVLCALRAANISVLLSISAEGMLIEDEEMKEIFDWLRSWDQLLLRNFLELCGNWIPAAHSSSFAFESKTELKWFQEWQMAISDPRVHKYPGLPWRSFVRRINAENFRFAGDFLDRVAMPASDENRAGLQQRIQGFLETKKKAICIFPKKWANKGPSAKPLEASP